MFISDLKNELAHNKKLTNLTKLTFESWLAKIVLDYKEPDFREFVLKQFVNCSKRVFVGETPELNEFVSKAYRKNPHSEVYYGKKSLLRINYF